MGTCVVQFVTGGYILYTVNGVQIDHTSENWTPDQAVYFGEVYATTDQMPGDWNHYEHFTQSRRL